MKKPLILVTNDDGLFAPGLSALVSVVKNLGQVVIVAPDSPQSGKGHAITITEPIRINQVSDIEGCAAYECSGTPVDCVKLARHVVLLDRTIDLCVSGINHGSNAAINIIYSGTMSAAMEASLEGINSIGFSLLDYRFDADFEPAKPYVQSICEKMLQQTSDQKALLLNVNIPCKNDIKGIRVCKQGEARWVEEFQEGTDPRGEKYYWLTGRFENHDKESTDTDTYALSQDFISIVPSMHDLTDYNAIEVVEELLQ